LVISTANVDIGPAPRAASALPILLRTVDLATSQNFSGELQQAEFEAAARRMAEYNFCERRLAAVDTIARLHFCQRDNLWLEQSQPHAATGGTIGPGLFSQIANTWQSTWVNRPESSGPGATGFSFDPVFMRNLFKYGVRTFQARCQESLALLNVPAQVRNASYACGISADAAVAEAEKSFPPLSSCHPDDHEIPNCE
jgi:hypothetical protein